MNYALVGKGKVAHIVAGNGEVTECGRKTSAVVGRRADLTVCATCTRLAPVEVKDGEDDEIVKAASDLAVRAVRRIDEDLRRWEMNPDGMIKQILKGAAQGETALRREARAMFGRIKVHLLAGRPGDAVTLSDSMIELGTVFRFLTVCATCGDRIQRDQQNPNRWEHATRDTNPKVRKSCRSAGVAVEPKAGWWREAFKVGQ